MKKSSETLLTVLLDNLRILLIFLTALLFTQSGTSQAVTITPRGVSRLFAYTNSIQGDGSGGDLNVDSKGPSDTPLKANAEADPINTNLDGWTLNGNSSFATASSGMIDPGGWSSFNDTDTFKLFVNNQATQDPYPNGPHGWGYSVSYAFITYDSAPSVGESLGDTMTVALDIDFFANDLYAADIYDDYFLDIGYAVGNGLVDYDSVLVDPANNENPGRSQFGDSYSSWRSTGSNWVSPSLSDSVQYNGVVGDEFQIILAMSSFSYSYYGYTWTDGTLDATVTAMSSAAPVPEPDTILLLSTAILGLIIFRRKSNNT